MNHLSETTLYETHIFLHGWINMLASCESAHSDIAFLTPLQLAVMLKSVERNVRLVMDLEKVPAENDIDELQLSIRSAI